MEYIACCPYLQGLQAYAQGRSMPDTNKNTLPIFLPKASLCLCFRSVEVLT